MMKAASVVLAASLTAALIPNITGTRTVSATTAKTMDNTSLGTAQIGNPKAPEDKDAAWTGNYVYFGNYNGTPIKFRVLASDTDVYGENTLFLDSDKILFDSKYHAVTDPADYDNSWENSDVRKTLNSTFLYDSFTGTEKNSIKGCYGTGGNSAYAAGTYEEFHFYGPKELVDDCVFLLDVGDILNPDYGYFNSTGYTQWISLPWEYETVKNHIKEGGDFWFLRTEGKGEEYADGTANIGSNPGGFSGLHSNENACGVAPALNVKQSSILFSTEIVAPDSDGYNGEYKLTVIDESYVYTLRSGEKAILNWSTLSFPAYFEGGANHFCMMILDKEYTPGNTNNASLLYYTMLTEAHSMTWTDTGLDFDGWGTDYHVYLVSEKTNGDQETDYASVPYEVAKADVVDNSHQPGDYSIKVTTDGNGTAAASKDYALTGEEITLTATPNEGYKFKEWTVEEGDITITDNKFTLGVYDVEIKAVFEKVEDEPLTPYGLVKIGDTEVTGEDDKSVVTDGTKDATFTIKGLGTEDNSFENLEYVAVDGTKLTKDAEYTAEKGSTIITLKASYLKTLSVGEHVILVNFKDGSTGVKLTVNAAPAPANMPATGESQKVMFIGSVLVIAALGIMFTVQASRKKEEA